MQELKGRLEAAGEERQQLGELQEGLLQEQEQLQTAMDLQQQAHRSTEVGPPPVPPTVAPWFMQGIFEGCCLWRSGACSSRRAAQHRGGTTSGASASIPMFHAKNVQGRYLWRPEPAAVGLSASVGTECGLVLQSSAHSGTLLWAAVPYLQSPSSLP